MDRACRPLPFALLLYALGTASATAAAADVKASDTVVLGPFVGQGAAVHPANKAPHPIEYYGTDLGFSYEHLGRLQLLFGDTLAAENGDTIERSNGGKFDDSYGSVDLARWNAPQEFKPGNIPVVLLGQNPNSSEAAAIDLGRPMEGFKTPIGAFSNGRSEFGVFFTYKPLGCKRDSDCPHHASCDTGLGEAGLDWQDPAGLTFACIDDSPSCRDATVVDARQQPVTPSGFCSDRSSSNWANTARGRIDGVLVQVLVARRDLAVPKRFAVEHTWYTRKFMNSHYRTVRAFDEPSRKDAIASDYHWADASASAGRVFIWGRPHFVGVNAAHRTLSGYFAYVDLPSAQQVNWQPRFFAGVDAMGQPLFSSDEAAAEPMDLDSARPGVQAEDPSDVVDQVSVAWVPQLSRWVMLYGGGLTTLPVQPALKQCGVLELFIGSECPSVVIGNGAIRMRSAEAPWGPWSAPQGVLVAGDPAIPQGQYGPGGVLYHADCKQPSCALPTRAREMHPREYGFLYAPNIIEQWSREAAGGADIYWNVSTWDPYRVVLVRTHLSR